MFAGVFTPSILTILGIILFLRLGYVVGSAGLGRALILIGLANAISIITSMSLAAITTNLRVKGGGVYYLISRTLGVQFGGSIGIVLFLAQAVSIAFYCMGFAEALCGILPDPLGTHTHIIAAAAVFLLFVLAWLGADWATRFQYVVMAIIAAALLSFFAGALSQWDSGLLVRNWPAPASGADFWLLFAIFFPAVTGFTQGVNMSGDLKDPGKSIPSGTFLAVGLSVIIYFSATILLSASLPNDVLAVELEAMNRLALLGFLIHAGVISATLSSGMASFLGAPRILQSLAADMIFPFLRPFAKGFGPTGNPRRGVLLSAGIAFVTVGLGELDLIAPVVSMFFLISYGLLNYATFYEARAASPSFRPSFRWFDARLSLLGGIACLGVMLAIDWAAGVVAVSVLFAVYQYLQRAAGPARWADSRRSFHLQRIRESLIAAENEPEHPRAWRPQVLAFSDDPSRRERLLRFASWIEGGSGMTTAVRILVGEGLKMYKLKEEADSELRFEIKQKGLSAFPRVVASPDLYSGVYSLVQSFGVGPLKANTILFNWIEAKESGPSDTDMQALGKNLRTAFRFGCNIIILSARDENWENLVNRPSNEMRIDVWWSGDPTSRLMLLLAYLMTRNKRWIDANIRVLAFGVDIRTEDAMDDLHSTLQDVRIEAEPVIVDNADAETIISYSSDAALTYLPFSFKGYQLVSPFGGALEALLSQLPAAAFVSAGGGIHLDADPEAGKHGEFAAAFDALAEAGKRAREAESRAAGAAEDAEEKLKAFQSAFHLGTDEEAWEKARAVWEARKEAKKEARRAAKAFMKAGDAALEAEALGVKPPEKKNRPRKPS